MHNTLEQLAKQAGMVKYPTGLGITENVIWGDRNIQQFATLIVQECAKIAELAQQGYKDYDPDVSTGHYIRSTFGVE
jgi:hypothetical protein